MNDISVLTVDDEPLSLLKLEQTLPLIPRVSQIGAALGAGEAIEKIKTLKPDVVLLDIRLRDGSGFDVVEQLPQDASSEIIFVTAFNEFATKAFEANAVDYLMKPVSAARLEVALERARERIETRGARRQVLELRLLVQELKRASLDERACEGQPAFWIKTRNGDLASVQVQDIDWVSSEDDYVRLHTRHGAHLMRGSIRAFLDRVGADPFVRVHRNAIVRRTAIRCLHRRDFGVEIELTSGARVRSGRVHAKALLRQIRELTGIG